MFMFLAFHQRIFACRLSHHDIAPFIIPFCLHPFCHIVSIVWAQIFLIFKPFEANIGKKLFKWYFIKNANDDDVIIGGAGRQAENYDNSFETKGDQKVQAIRNPIGLLSHEMQMEWATSICFCFNPFRYI